MQDQDISWEVAPRIAYFLEEPAMDYRFVKTTCPFCGCGCQMLLEVLDGKLIGTVPLKKAPMNDGKLCIKGWNAHEFVHSPNRLTTPLVRKNGALQAASWDEALDFTVVPAQRDQRQKRWRQPRVPLVGQMH